MEGIQIHQLKITKNFMKISDLNPITTSKVSKTAVSKNIHKILTSLSPQAKVSNNHQHEQTNIIIKKKKWNSFSTKILIPHSVTFTFNCTILLHPANIELFQSQS